MCSSLLLLYFHLFTFLSAFKILKHHCREPNHESEGFASLNFFLHPPIPLTPPNIISDPRSSHCPFRASVTSPTTCPDYWQTCGGKLRGLHLITAFCALSWSDLRLSTHFSPLVAGGCACTDQPKPIPHTRTTNRISCPLGLPYGRKSQISTV